MKKSTILTIITAIVVSGILTVLGCNNDDGISTQTGAKADKFISKLFDETNPLVLGNGWAWVIDGDMGYIFYDNGDYVRIIYSGGEWTATNDRGTWFTDGIEVTIGPNTFRYEIRNDTLTLRHVTNTNLVIMLQKRGGINIS